MIDRRNNLPPVEDQVLTKKCVASAFATLAYENGESVDSDTLYQRAKYLDRINGNENVDEGTDMQGGRLALDALTTTIDVVPIAMTRATIDTAISDSSVVFHAQTKLFDGDMVGLHAATIVGAKENEYLVRNSWGIGYGDNGYKWIPKDNLIHHSAGQGFMARKKKVKSDSRKKQLMSFGGVVIALAIATIGALTFL